MTPHTHQPLDSAMTQFQALLSQLQQQQNHRPALAEKLEQASHIYLLGPSSFLGLSFTVPLAQRLRNLAKHVTLVDDTLSTAPAAIQDCIVISTTEFLLRPTERALAIDMANSLFASGFFRAITQRCGMVVMDIIEALDIFNLPVIYQTAQTMREATLHRIDDYESLATQLNDALSIQTLGACLQMRVTGKRDAVIPVLCSLEDEYFSPFPAGKDVTFTLGEKEILCDIGAHIGTTIGKFLTATNWEYSHIYAFEPDAVNFSSLQKGLFRHLRDFDVKNIALSDTQEVLTFSETGTMGSRIDKQGNVQIQASTLDDEVESATFIKMDVEGHEARILRGAQRLITQSRPRMAITGYHYADDLLEIAKIIKELEPRYRLRLRHHSYYYYDTILYADIP